MKDMQRRVLDEILEIRGKSDKRVHMNDSQLAFLTREVCDQEKVRLDWMLSVADNANWN